MNTWIQKKKCLIDISKIRSPDIYDFMLLYFNWNKLFPHQDYIVFKRPFSDSILTLSNIHTEDLPLQSTVWPCNKATLLIMGIKTPGGPRTLLRAHSGRQCCLSADSQPTKVHLQQFLIISAPTYRLVHLLLLVVVIVVAVTEVAGEVGVEQICQ